LRRHAYFTSKRVIEKDNQADHGAREERDESAKKQVSSELQVEHPKQEHVDQRPDRDRVPHDGRVAGGDAEKARTSILEELIDKAATFIDSQNTLLVNADFCVFTDMIGRLCKDEEASPSAGLQHVVEEVVHQWFEQALVN
jgi:hypothetical protein